MPTLPSLRLIWIVPLLALAVQAQDLHIKKSITVGGNFVASTETSIKGSRERTVSQSPSGSTISLRQCDLKRTITINDQAQTYFIANDPQDDAAIKAAAMLTGAAPATDSAAYITETSTITDTGERKTMYGYPARHLKARVTVQSSQSACSQVSQSFDLDGWYTDLSKEQSSACGQFLPPIRQTEGCNDRVISHRSGSGKPGYPLTETLTLRNADGTTTQIGVQTSEISKQALDKDLFEIPPGYREVKSLAELNGAANPQAAQQPAAYAPPAQGNGGSHPSAGQTMNPAALQQQMMAQAQQMMGRQSPGNGAQGMGGGQPGGSAVAAPQVLGPKAPGKIRIGVAPPDAQVGQGNNAGADYSTPIRNAEVALMSGPAIEIAALDSHIPIQLQAEAQQKQCDYILFSGVTVKHSQGGGFGKFMKMGSMAASMTPMGAMAHGVGGAVAAQAAAQAASMAAQQAQQQAISQLSGFNGQIKSKDDVTVQYQLVATGQTAPLLQNSLQGKAKSDGEDVLTPLLQQAATSVLTEVSKK